MQITFRLWCEFYILSYTFVLMKWNHIKYLSSEDQIETFKPRQPFLFIYTVYEHIYSKMYIIYVQKPDC